MSAAKPTPLFRERLWPNLWIFIVTGLFMIPAVTLVMTPINSDIALGTAIVLYVIVAYALLALSPAIEVSGGNLVAGRAQIPIEMLGRHKLLGATALHRELGPMLDARAYLLVRGWIKQAVKLENIDAQDPAPYWIITTRRPTELAAAIATAAGRPAAE